jgi:hypothetical protein
MSGLTGGALATHPDTISTTPCIVVGMPKGSTRTGSQQRTTIEQPFRLYVERVADEARTAALVQPWVTAVIAALAPINSAQTAGLWAVITGIDWDTDRYYEVGGAAYHAIDFTVHMEQIETVSTYGAI